MTRPQLELEREQGEAAVRAARHAYQAAPSDTKLVALETAERAARITSDKIARAEAEAERARLASAARAAAAADEALPALRAAATAAVEGLYATLLADIAKTLDAARPALVPVHEFVVAQERADLLNQRPVQPRISDRIYTARPALLMMLQTLQAMLTQGKT